MVANKRIALVSGGSRGIGAAISSTLAQKGYAVLVNYRTNTSAAESVVAEIEQRGGQASAIQGDIARADDRQRLVAAAFAEANTFALLVNNAGIAPPNRCDILDLTESDYRQVIQTNLDGTFFLTQAIAKAMLAEQSAAPRAIVTISSISAEFASSNRAAYCVAKAGLAMMTQLFADRLAGAGINVYEIRPGIIATDMTAGVKEKYDQQISAGLTPIRRWGTPADVAAAVAAVADGHFAFSTGEIFNVDGGLHIRRF